MGGSWTQLEEGSLTIDLNRYYELKVIASGASLSVYLDGQQKAAVTDAAISSGGVGLSIYKATTLFDDARLTRTTTYRYSDASGDLLNELDASGNVIASYVLDSDGDVIALVRGASKYFLHYNAHGDVIAITDESGATIAKFGYDPWGVPTEYNAAGSLVPLGSWDPQGPGLFFLFGGMVYDMAAGLYLTRTRAYNPRTGRFIQRDILDEKGKDGVYAGFPFGKNAIGTNLYAWCTNNPASKIDPNGTEGYYVSYTVVESVERIIYETAAFLDGLASLILGRDVYFFRTVATVIIVYIEVTYWYWVETGGDYPGGMGGWIQEQTGPPGPYPGDAPYGLPRVEVGEHGWGSDGLVDYVHATAEGAFFIGSVYFAGGAGAEAYCGRPDASCAQAAIGLVGLTPTDDYACMNCHQFHPWEMKEKLFGEYAQYLHDAEEYEHANGYACMEAGVSGCSH